MTENVNFFDKLDRLSTSFYSHHDINLENKNDDDNKEYNIKKKVSFQKKLTIIPIESYKEYNKQHTYPRNSKVVYKKISCNCNIY